MDPQTFVDPNLPQADQVLLENLLQDIKDVQTGKSGSIYRPGPGDSGYISEISEKEDSDDALISDKKTRSDRDEAAIQQMHAWNDPDSKDFQPTVFSTWDLDTIQNPFVRRCVNAYIAWARGKVRVETDVVMITHLILYFSTSVPSAIMLYNRFSWVHGVFHWLMQSYFVGTYTLLMHQHIHMGGVLARTYAWFDYAFPFILDPLMGHTWNTYFYHHVKHHHVEGNGPDDLSSTLRYQRDDLWNFLCYVGRFYFLIWFDLPRYFLHKNKPKMALKAGGSEILNYFFIATMAYFNLRPTLFVLMLPLAMLRVGLMVGNWGQHAFVDDVDPNSDFRSSITLIDVASNRFCYNDGYHTSHHLNPRRHWREHPASFLKQKSRYRDEGALTFRNIDYIMVTVRLLRKDYMHLAKCLVPMGEQICMTLEEKAAMLETKTRRFTEEDIVKKFGKATRS